MQSDQPEMLASHENVKKKKKIKKGKVFSLSLSFFPQKVARAENIVDEQKEIQAREICENKKSTASSPTD